MNSPNGAAAYVGGNDQNKSFQLPLLRTDVYSGSINFDSYIHVSNSTSGSTNLTFTFFNSDGSTNSTRNVPVPSTISAWQTVDVDLAQVLGTAFKGSGVVTSSPSAVAVSVTFTNGSLNIDNLDAYAGIPSGATSAYFPLAINYGDYTTHFWVHNTSSSAPANITYTLWTNGSIPAGGGPTTSVVGANATLQLGIISFNFVGPAQITSDQPIAVIAEVSGGAISATGVMTPPESGSSVFIPRYEVNNNPQTTWTSNFIVMNTTPTNGSSNCNATFHANFLNPDGSLAGSLATPTGGVLPMRSWVVGSLPFQQNVQAPVPDGFAGSVIVTQTGGNFPIVPMVFTLQGSLSKQNAINVTDTYSPATSAQAAYWTYLPNILKSVNGQTTAFAMMNTNSTPQDYLLTYWDHSGNPVSLSTLSLSPNVAWYASQAVDPSLPPGFDGSVQIQNISGGAPPAAVVQMYAGASSPPGPIAPSPTPFATLTPTRTPTPTMTPTRLPNMTPQAYAPIVINQLSGGW